MSAPAIQSLVNGPIRALREKVMVHVEKHGRATVLGANLDKLVHSGSGKSLVTLAFTSDFLRLMVNCILADRSLTASEIQYAYPFLGPASGLFARYRPEYQEFSGLNKAHIGSFLEFYAADKNLLGLQCRYTRWAGIRITNNIAAYCDDSDARDYARDAYLAFGDGLRLASGGGPEIDSILSNVSDLFESTEVEVDESDMVDLSEVDFEVSLTDLVNVSDSGATSDEELGFDLGEKDGSSGDELEFDLADFEISEEE